MFGGVGGGGMGGYMMPAGGFWIQTVLDKTAFSEASRSMAMLGTEMKILGRDFMIAGGLIATPMVLAAKEASRATVIQRAFNAVFRDGTAEASRFVNSMARSTGRFTTDLQESLMSIQALFRGMNFGDKSTGMAQFTQSLMTDLAAFRGLTDQDVMQRFVSTLSGSVEAMDQLGIDVHEHAIQQELLAMGINKSVQEASEQEKIMARLNVIHKAMGQQGAIGAATRALYEFDGKITVLTTSLKELQQEVGEALQPFLEDVLPTVTDLVTAFKDWVSVNPTLVRNIGAVTAGIATLGGAMWTAGAAWRVLAFGLSAFMNPMVMAAGSLGVAFGLWQTNAYLASRRTAQLTADVQEFLEVSGRLDEWSALNPLRLQKEQLMNEVLQAQLDLRDRINSNTGVNWVEQFRTPIDEYRQKIVELQAALDAVTIDLKNAESEILSKPITGGLADGLRLVAEEVGWMLEDEISGGIKKGFLKGIEGTFSSLSQRMFANRFSESVGEEIAGGRRATRLGALGGSPFGTGRDVGEVGPETALSGFGQGVTGFEGLGATGNRQRHIAEVNRRRALRGLPPIDDRYSQAEEPQPHEAYAPPEGYSYVEQGLPEQYRPDDDLSWITPETAEPGHPDGSPANPLTNPATGTWIMRGKPGGNRFGRFVPHQGPPNIQGSQGATEFPVAPSLEDQPGLGAFGGGRPADPWAAEPRYREDTSLINEVREQVKGMESVKEAILDLITTLSNPETFQQRYE